MPFCVRLVFRVPDDAVERSNQVVAYKSPSLLNRNLGDEIFAAENLIQQPSNQVNTFISNLQEEAA
jgi:hypothetical protein